MQKEFEKMNYEEYESEVLKIKAEFINIVKRNVKPIKNIKQNEIMKLAYDFIFDKVSKKTDIKVEEKDLFFDFFLNTIKFCLTYSVAVFDAFSELEKISQDFKIKKIQN